MPSDFYYIFDDLFVTHDILSRMLAATPMLLDSAYIYQHVLKVHANIND